MFVAEKNRVTAPFFNSLLIWTWSSDLSLSFGIPGQPNHNRSLGSDRDDMPVATPPMLSLYT